MNSLQGRLLLAALFVLLAFVVLTGLALERAFFERALQAERDKLQGLIYALLGASDVTDERRLVVNEGELPDERLSRPASGLYLAVLDVQARPIWTSPSLLEAVPSIMSPAIGEWKFNKFELGRGHHAFLLAFGVHWSGEGNIDADFTFMAMEDSAAFNRQLLIFQRTLFFWLGFAALLLLVVLIFVLRWGLRPVKRLATDLTAIESGEQEQMQGTYPTELMPLTTSLNALLQHERQRQRRYQNALDDLAHSLKTPLAVLRGLAVEHKLSHNHLARINEQVLRIDQIVQYQLQKAAMTGTKVLTRPLPLINVVKKVVTALTKVYHEKSIDYQIDVPGELSIRMERGDLIELLGNLLDNASKWCHKTVGISAELVEGNIKIIVYDDGPGYATENTAPLLKRGVRADSKVDGQGIGLSVVAEIAKAYESEIQLKGSHLGGAQVELLITAT